MRSDLFIVPYHGVVEKKMHPRLERNFLDVKEFKGQISRLKKIKILQMDEIKEYLKNSTQYPKQCAVITFDDGYKNNLLAAQMLKEAKLPWTVFVSTGFVGGDRPLWTVELSLLILEGHCEKLSLFGRNWNMKARSERELAFQEIRKRFKLLAADAKNNHLEELRAQFPADETQRLFDKYPSLKMMNWDDVRALRNDDVEVGSHGVFHEIHHQYQMSEVRSSEIKDSKKSLEEQLGRVCKYFAFPNGNFCEESVLEVKKTGYEIGLTMEDRLVSKLDNPLTLPRKGISVN